MMTRRRRTMKMKMKKKRRISRAEAVPLKQIMLARFYLTVYLHFYVSPVASTYYILF